MPASSHPPKNSTALDVIGDKDLVGKVALITGANSGIGFEAARALALHNCRVFLACRNPNTAAEAKMAILKEHTTADIRLLQLDLTELSSVKTCAETFLKTGYPLHILILNAGVYNPPHRVTDDGFEATFQINHLSQWLFTQVLMERIVNSAPARIIVVASDAYRMVRSMTPSQLEWEKLSPTHAHGLNSAMSAYGLSKFCNVLFARELNRQYKNKGVSTFSLHPGVVKTNIFRNPGSFGFLGKLMKPFMKTSEQGASTTVYLAVAEDIEKESGNYFVDCRRKPLTSAAGHLDNADKLWNLSQQMINHHENILKRS